METWTETDVPGYMVSTVGRMAKLMSTNPGALGYPQFSLVAPGTSGRVRRYLHDLVLTAFVGPRPEGAVARHLNDDPTDNRLVNLAWGTRSENQRDALRNGRRTHKKICNYGHPLAEPNLQNNYGNRCKACLWARVKARRLGIDVTQEMRDFEYERIVG